MAGQAAEVAAAVVIHTQGAVVGDQAERGGGAQWLIDGDARIGMHLDEAGIGGDLAGTEGAGGHGGGQASSYRVDIGGGAVVDQVDGIGGGQVQVTTSGDTGLCINPVGQGLDIDAARAAAVERAGEQYIAVGGTQADRARGAQAADGNGVDRRFGNRAGGSGRRHIDGITSRYQQLACRSGIATHVDGAGRGGQRDVIAGLRLQAAEIAATVVVHGQVIVVGHQGDTGSR